MVALTQQKQPKTHVYLHTRTHTRTCDGSRLVATILEGVLSRLSHTPPPGPHIVYASVSEQVDNVELVVVSTHVRLKGEREREHTHRHTRDRERGR